MSEEIKRSVGRPKKPEVPYDAEEVENFVKRLFSIEKEIITLREDKKQLKEEFKSKINNKLISKVVRLVKIELALEQENASEQTVEEISNIVKDKINMVVSVG
jgi:hypothetical protein